MTVAFLDYRGRAAVAAMEVGGMTVVERAVREAARAGAARAVVRADALPALPRLPIEVTRIADADPPPADATAMPAATLAGVEIVDERSRRVAARALLQSLRRPYDGLGDRYVIRAMSLRVTGVLARLRATPNQVTAVNIVVGLVACWLAQVGTRAAFAAAGAAMVAQAVLDSCDGELARLRHLSSKFGMWLDNTSDDVIDNLFVAMLAVGIAGPWQWIGIACACARACTAVMIHVDVWRRGRPGDVMSFTWWFDTAGEELAERFDTDRSLLGVVRAFGRRDAYVLVWGATCLATVPVVGLAISCAISVAYFALATLHVVAVARRPAS